MNHGIGVFTRPAGNTPDAAPVPPRKPDDEECCHGGCERCVLELYEEALERYRAALRAWEEKNGIRPGP
jgi:hypothetical protein